MNYQEILTDTEINNIVSLLQTENTEGVLDIIAFYGECSLMFSAIVSGDIVVTGIRDGSLEYHLSQKAKKRLH